MKQSISIEIRPIYKIAEIRPDTHYILISSESKYDWMDEYSNVCLLHFADTEYGDHPDAISFRHTSEIAKFMGQCGYGNGKIVVACDEGKSRSPALAAALLSIYGQDDSYIWKNKDYRPNTLVFRRLLEYYGQYAPADKLNDVRSRPPEIYRSFRKHDKDPAFEYDWVIERNAGLKLVRYGFIYGDIRQVIFIKAGGGGDIIGADEKYLKAAAYLHELYGSTVIASSNPYDGSDSLHDAEALIREYLRNKEISESDAEVLYFGYSDGAKLIADYGTEHDLFSSILMYNLPLEKTETEDTAMRLSEMNKNSTVTVVYGEEDESFRSAGQRLHSTVPEIEMHVIKGADHRLSAQLAIILPQLFFKRNALVANGVDEIPV